MHSLSALTPAQDAVDHGAGLSEDAGVRGGRRRGGRAASRGVLGAAGHRVGAL